MTAAAMWVGGAFLSATTATIDSFDMTSGANDIVVVRDDDGFMQSSAFNVRFGKAKVIRRSDKYVYLEVNGKRVQGALLKLGPSGEAFWVTPATRGVPAEARCSPITSPRSPPDTSPAGSQGSSPDSTGQDVSFELGRGVASDATKQKEHVDPAQDLMEEDMMGDAEADDMLAESSEILKQLKERLHLESAQQEAEVSGAIPVMAGAPSNDDDDLPEDHELRLARSAEGPGKAGMEKLQSLMAEGATGGSLPDAVEGATMPPADLKISMWKRVHDRETGKDVFWNMRTNECTDIPPPDYESDDESAAAFGEAPALSSDEEDQMDDENICAKTLFPTKEQLAKLDLKPGENEMTFVVYTTLRGRQSVTCSCFLWEANAQVVVSDVDGTVTRSDVLGHILPKVGKDWAHSGICSLYNRIVDNGYNLIYLSSRSISQIQSTREYLDSVVQDDKRLPRGPLLVAPDRIFAAFTREVVKRTPHEFKMRMLHSVKTAYPEASDPFYAGFGNRVNDAWAYTSVGIKDHKIFLIDPNSLIHVFDKRVKFRAYGSLDQLADQAFPARNVKKKIVPTEFNSFNFWCLSPSMGVDDDDDTNEAEATTTGPTTEARSGNSPPPSSRPGLAAAWGSPPSVPPAERSPLSPPRSPVLEGAISPSAKDKKSDASPGGYGAYLSSLFGKKTKEDGGGSPEEEPLPIAARDLEEGAPETEGTPAKGDVQKTEEGTSNQGTPTAEVGEKTP